jgi:hypothetical protein
MGHVTGGFAGAGGRLNESAERVSWIEIQRTMLRMLSRVADGLDRRPGLCAFILAACFLPVALLQSQNKFLKNDEIYTVHIAQAPTVRELLSMSREIDLHPPLHYLVQRAALKLPLPRYLSSRLPSMVAGLISCFALFWYTAKRLGYFFGTVAVTLFWFSPGLDFSWSNRPYALWLAFLCLLMLARDVAVRAYRPRWAVPAVFLLTLGMVGTHLLGILCIGPFLLVEGFRAQSRGRVDWPLVFALSAPALLGFGYLYQIHHLSHDVFPVTQMPGLSLAVDTYAGMFGNAVLIVGGIVLTFVTLFGPAGRIESVFRTSLRERTGCGLTRDDVILLTALLLLPLGVLLAGMVLHLQFWPRYGMASLPAFAVLSLWLLARRFLLARAMAVLVLVSAVAYMAYVLVIDTGPQSNVGVVSSGRTPIPLATLNPVLPIVTASPMMFVEMSDRESPAIAHRLFYLTDVKAAYQYAHYTLFENEGKIRKMLNLPSQTQDLPGFLASHRQFYLVGDYNAKEIWLPRKLAADGLKLDYLGKFESSYESDDLYLVSR